MYTEFNEKACTEGLFTNCLIGLFKIPTKFTWDANFGHKNTHQKTHDAFG